MQSQKLNPIIRWWVTPKLPYHDIFELPLLRNKSVLGRAAHLFSHWLIHPFKRRLARWYLKILQKFTGIKVIGVTGSAGKSTTVRMLASILQQSAKTSATPPSIDPVYNVPNTILKTPYGTKFLILEFSIEYPGEMDYYLWLAKPDIGVITNIFPTHTEFLGDIEGVAQEKGKLVESLTKDDFAVLNKRDQRLIKLAQKTKAKILWFSAKDNPLEQNAQAAKTVCKCLNISSAKIAQGIKNYERPEHRLKIIHHKSGAVILDDSYNSNPQAALASLNVFNKLAGKNSKIAVLGDMLELGKYEEEGHRLVGKKVAESNFNYVVGVGRAVKFLLDEVNKDSPKTKTILFPTLDNVLKEIRQFLRPGRNILIKGSRSIGLDKLVDDIMVDSRL